MNITTQNHAAESALLGLFVDRYANGMTSRGPQLV